MSPQAHEAYPKITGLVDGAWDKVQENIAPRGPLYQVDTTRAPGVGLDSGSGRSLHVRVE